MTSYYEAVRQCPGCKSKFISMELASTNNFGLDLYTDGCWYMMAKSSPVIRCPACKGLFRQADVSEFDRENDAASVPTEDDFSPGKLPWAEDLFGEEDYREAVEMKLWKGRAEEKYVRSLYWQAFNDGFRGSRKVFCITDEQKENLERMLELADPGSADDNVIKAEILRELGHFEECLVVLESFKDVGQNPFVATIKKLALEKQARVSKVPLEDPFAKLKRGDSK